MSLADEMLISATRLKADVFLDLRGIPTHRRPILKAQLDVIEQRMQNAASILEYAATIIREQHGK